MSRLRFATVGEDRGAACLLSFPGPRVTLHRQLMRTEVALAVKEVRPVRLARRIVADDLRSPHIAVPDAAIGGMENEEPARHPFVDITGQDLDGRRVRAGDGVALVDPLADKDVQALVRGARHGDALCHAPGSFIVIADGQSWGSDGRARPAPSRTAVVSHRMSILMVRGLSVAHQSIGHVVLFSYLTLRFRRTPFDPVTHSSAQN